MLLLRLIYLCLLCLVLFWTKHVHWARFRVHPGQVISPSQT